MFPRNAGKKRVWRPFTSKYISFKRDGISRWLRWPANLWNISLEKKKKVTTRRVPFATFSTYVEMSQWNAFHQRRNDSSELHTSSNDRRNKGISPTYCVEIGMQVEASWPIAIVSRSSQILDTFKSPRLLGCSIGRETRRFNLDPSPCFLFYSFIFLLLFSFFFPPSSSSSFLDRFLLDTTRDLAWSTQMDHRCCSIRQTSIFIRANNRINFYETIVRRLRPFERRRL